MKLDDLLLIQFQQLPLDGIATLMSYCPSDTHNEPNTYLFSNYLAHMVPGLDIIYPVSDFETCTIAPMQVNDHTEFHLNNYGIEEPVNGTPIDPLLIDLVFVPILICDTAGYRVGFGKGFYDRFLSRCREDVIKIGFSYFEPVEHISDTHQFDIPLSGCITPQSVIVFD